MNSHDADIIRIGSPESESQAESPAPRISAPPATGPGALEERMIWDELKTIYDPEIPVNIVDLGLIYSVRMAELEQGGKRIEVEMSLTAPGCGMSEVLKATAEDKLSRLPEAKEVQVKIVFDPPWHMGLMSEAAKLQLGLPE